MKRNFLSIPFIIMILLVAACSDTSVGSDDEPIAQPPVDDPVPDPDPDPDPDPEPTDDDGFRTLAVPVQLENGMEWEFQEFSDDFEYDAPAGNLGPDFDENWIPFYHNPWTGPGLTEWDRGFPFVAEGMLQIPARRKPGSNKINTGCITGKTRVQYPVYIETRAKIMNAVLANAAWLLSPDDTQEIDFLEAYGASFSESANSNHSWFAERVHISHHVFIREPFTDWQPTDAGSWYTDGSTLWREDFHTYGVYWRDPWHLEYYIDGQLVRTVSGKDAIDPVFHTNEVNPGDTSNDTRTGLSKEMDIIINVEDQDWRSTPESGLQQDTYTPTDSELANEADHTFLVDWIRIFKPVASQQ